MIEKIAERALNIFTEPFMVLALFIIYGCYRVILFLLSDRKKDDSVLAAIKQQTQGLSECNNTLAAVLTLIEVVVYGKDGKQL